MKAECGVNLGYDIIFYDGQNIEKICLANRYRFLDNLWLPVPLISLSPEQICVINRYREDWDRKSQPAEHAAAARSLLEAAMSAVDANNVLEIGSGKFPLAAGDSRYFAVDIDPEALKFLRENGLNACHPDNLKSQTFSTKFDFFASNYALHFSIDEEFLNVIELNSTDDAVLCFNAIADDSIYMLQLMSRFAINWPLMSIIKLQQMARREFLYVFAKPNGVARLERILTTLRP